MLLQRPVERLQHSIQIIRMNIGDPRVAVARFRVRTRKRNSSIVQIGDLAIHITHPHQRGRGIRHHAEALLALAKAGLSFPLSRSLPKQANDQQCLKGDQRNGRNEISPVSFPQCGLSIQD